MSRVATTWYGALTDTQFQWATTDNDRFDRELDLYRLAQALELHTHETGKGLPVGRLAALSITSTMYGNLSIPSTAYQDLSILGSKIAAGTITDDKMANQKVNRVGDTMTGDLRVQRTAGGVSGAVLFGSSTAIMYFDGTGFQIATPAGGFIDTIGVLRSYRGDVPTTGYLYLGTGGANISFNGTDIVASWGSNNGIIALRSSVAEVPLGGTVAFRTAAELTAAGGRWTRDTFYDGRMVAGAGTANTGGVTLNENTWYGTNWQPMTGLTVGIGSLAVSGYADQAITNQADSSGAHIFLAAAASSNNSTGATNVSTAAHVNPNTLSAGSGGSLSGAPSLSGTTTNYLPPTFVAVWGRRTT